MCSHYKPVSHINQLRQAFGLGSLEHLGRPDMWPGYEGLFIRPHPHADVGDEAMASRSQRARLHTANTKTASFFIVDLLFKR